MLLNNGESEKISWAKDNNLLSDLALIYTTFPDKTNAEEISTYLLQKKLIACANIFPMALSIYSWKGNTEKNEEVIALLKTQKKRVNELQSEFLKKHPYDCPCFIEIKKGFPKLIQEAFIFFKSVKDYFFSSL